MKNLTTTWRTEWENITKGQSFTYECDNNTETTSVVDYVVQNKYYSLVVLSNGFEYTLHTKLWLELSQNN